MKNIILPAALLAVSIISCQKPDPIYKEKDVLQYVDVEVPVEIPVEVPVTPPCSYYFNGEQFSVYTVTCSESPDYTEFLIAREHEKPFHSYIYFAIAKEHMGKAVDINRLTNRIDYRMVFETPSVYYSEYYRPSSGTIAITPLDKDGEYEFSLDLSLYDGKTLKIFYSGIFSTIE